MAEAPADKARDLAEPAATGVGDRPVTDAAALRVDPEEIVDVWSRTEPKYRTRALVLLLINLGLFCGLCVFTFWLRAARPFDVSLASYVSPARFWAPGPNLTDFLIEPISVKDTPLHAVVLGLLFGAIFTVPIVISILYRFVSALPFVAAVLVFAHMPWMAFTLLWSCVLASLPPFRMKFRYASALVGLLPVLVYLILAGAGTGDLGVASPTEKTLMAMPWVLAVLASAVMIAICLQLAKFLNYRPGPVAPIVSIMFAAPVVLFHVGIGVDELDYRVLEHAYGPRSRAFEPVQDPRPKLRQLVLSIARNDELYKLYLPDFLAALQGEPFPNPRLVLQYFVVEFMADRARAYQACRNFVADHPKSRYVPEVLFIQARVLDTRLNERALLGRTPSRELYFDFPHVQSEKPWSDLQRQFPDSVLSAAAALRLAQLRLREGRIDEVLALLSEQHARRAAMLRGRPTSQPVVEPLLARTPPEEALGFEVEPYLREAWRLEQLVRNNKDDPKYGDAPLVALASLDPHRIRYAQQLLRLADAYSDALLFDNLMVAYAVTLPSPRERATVLARLAARLGDGDAQPEIQVSLANLEIQSLADEASTARAMQRLRRIARGPADDYWSDEARRMLRIYEPPAAEGATP